MKQKIIQISFGFCLLFFAACKKMVDIKLPFQLVVTDKVFSNTEDAKSAVAGMFYTLGQSSENFANAGTTILCGLSADELAPFNQSADVYNEVYNNSITEANFLMATTLWNPAYTVIYNANAIITGLEHSVAISKQQQDSLAANALFARAFSYFYLVNYFGDVPLVTTIDYKKSSVLPRSKTNLVYDLMVDDLTKAQNFLPVAYSGGRRIMPTKWAAKALLARVYLYQKKWEQATAEADSVISQSGLFSLSADLDKVFTVNSREAIWQLESNINAFSGVVTQEGQRFIPYPSVAQSIPAFYLTAQLVSRFDSADNRLIHWTAINNYKSGNYRLPYKYKEGRAQNVTGHAVNEYNTVLRLAELYLIRAEALVQLNKTDAAKDDLNRIRQRAGLEQVAAVSNEALLDTICNENQKEFFVEWGHRWMDLKRWGRADAVLSAVKGSVWQSTDQLYPLPLFELNTAPNLVQNPGY